MRRLLILTVFILITVQLYADDEIFKGLQINHICMTWVDFGITITAISKYQIDELNPIAKFYFKRPGLAISIHLIDNIFVHWLSSHLYKKNKILAYLVIGGSTLLRSFIFYHNLNELI